MSRLAALALAAALVLGLVGCDTSSALPGGSADLIPNPAASQTVPADGQDAAFQMHFIDVGQALSVLVECDGQFMLYDGGNVDDGSLVVSYLQSQGVEQLEYVFCSHAHEDHVGGLAAALAYFPAYHVYSPVTEASTKCFKDFVKYTQQQNLQVEVPTVGTQWALGSATVTMLGPVAQYEETNDTSIVLRIDYGATSFLLTGDMEADAERDLVASGANLKVDVLQVGARNMQNFDLLRELGKLRKPILLKRGLANTLKELLMSAEYIMAGGNEQVILCERGIRTFDDYTRNTLDLAAVPMLHELTHLPVIVDPSHATGINRLVSPMAMAATACTAAGLIIEVHNDPIHALCDGAQSLRPEQFDTLMGKIRALREVVAE